MESNEKKKRGYGGLWFRFLIVILILVMLFLGPAEPLIIGSAPWLLIVFAFFVSLACGIWLGLRRGHAIDRSIRAKT